MRNLTRTEAVTALLETYNDATTTLQSGNARGSDGGLMLMPNAYKEGSYRELERVLTLMRETRRSQWWHVNERYIRCQRTTRDLPFKKGKLAFRLTPHQEIRHAGGDVSGTARCVIYSWAPQVDMGKVRRGVDWIANTMHGEIWLPDDVFDAVAA